MPLENLSNHSGKIIGKNYRGKSHGELVPSFNLVMQLAGRTKVYSGSPKVRPKRKFRPSSLLPRSSSHRTGSSDTMNSTSAFLQCLRRAAAPATRSASASVPRLARANACSQPSTSTTCRRFAQRPFSSTRPRLNKQAADDPLFESILDGPPKLVRAGRRHGPGLILLGMSSSSQPIIQPRPAQRDSS